MTFLLNMGSSKTNACFSCRKNVKTFEVQTMIGLIEKKLAVFRTLLNVKMERFKKIVTG